MKVLKTKNQRQNKNNKDKNREKSDRPSQKRNREDNGRILHPVIFDKHTTANRKNYN